MRHGKTMLNTTDRVQGFADAPLTQAGIDVAKKTALGLEKVSMNSAYSSDSGRSIETANILLTKQAPTLILKLDPRLREFNFGTYEGDLNETMWTDIAKSQGLTLKEWFDAGISVQNFANSVAILDAKVRAKSPSDNWAAEDYTQITARLKASLEEIVAQSEENGGGNILIVSHGLSIAAMVNIFDTQSDLKAGSIKNASVTKISFKDGIYKVEAVSDLSFAQ